jgi:hypothetical protein
LRCVEGADVSKLKVLPFDGRNREAAAQELLGTAAPTK